MKRKTIFILVNGILTIPGDAKDWNAEGVNWIHTRRGDSRCFAEKLEYWCGPIGRAFGQTRRARKLADLIAYYRQFDFDIILAGHSNGCDVILDALALLKWPRIEVLHLFSGACEADFIKNGLNTAATLHRVGKINIYIAGKDRWLRLAHTCFGRWLGYGALGFEGARKISPTAAGITTTLIEPEFDHSTWWTEEQFDRSLTAITGV